MDNKSVGFSRRLLAHCIDFFVLLTPVMGAIYFVANNSNSFGELIINTIKIIAFFLLPITLLNTFYSVFFLHIFGATIGKLLVGFQILDKNGKKLSLQRLFFRQTVGMIASSLLFGLGFYSIIKNPHKQAWHDEMVGSFPFSKRNTWPFAVLALAFIVSINIYLGYTSAMTFIKNDSLKKDLTQFVGSLTKTFQPTNSNNQTNQQFNLLIEETRQNYYKGDFNKQLELSQTSFNTATTDQEKGIALYWRGLAKYKLATGSDKTAAQTDMNESLKLYPENAGPYVTLSAIEIEKGNYQTALTLAQKCAQIDPKYAWCHNNIGSSLFFLGKKDEAIIELEQAVSLSPESVVFQDNLRRAKLGR